MSVAGGSGLSEPFIEVVSGAALTATAMPSVAFRIDSTVPRRRGFGRKPDPALSRAARRIISPANAFLTHLPLKAWSDNG